jgi:PAS domain S-box-containing protein
MDKKQKILIVDDKRENLVALRQVLSGVDAEIVEATSGNQALTTTLVHEFSLAILDVQMPVMDGYELAELLRGDSKTGNLPVIFMTAAYGEEIDVFKGYESGAVDYIVKPYKPAVLLAKVRVFLDLQNAQKELARRVLELSTSEERYRTLVTTIPDIVYRIDTEGRFTFLNNAVKSLGYSPEELIGRPFAEIVMPADIERISRRFVLPKFAGKRTGDEGAPNLFDERRTGSRQTLTMEVRLVSRGAKRALSDELHSSGRSILTAEVSSSGLYDSIEGHPPIFLGTVGIIRDISKRKKVEDEISRYRQGLEKMVEEQTLKLKKRVKEINCLYAILLLIEKPSESINKALKSAVELIPAGWKYQKVTRVRIVFRGREFASEGFRETPWKLSADIALSGETVGKLEVCYLEEKPALDAGPFLKEENELIEELARQLAVMIQSKLAHGRLEHINGVLRSIRDVNKLIVTEKQRGPIIRMTCENLTRTRSLGGAWIVLTDGLPDRVEDAQSGFNVTVFSELLNLFKRGKTPACFGHGQTESGVNVISDPAVACRNCPLAENYGGNGAITIELKHDNRRYGYMGIAVPVEFANDKEEASLFEEVAGDIAFVLASIEKEEALVASEIRYRRLFESSEEGILLIDAETGKVIDVNPFLIELLGFSHETFLDKNIWELEFFKDTVGNRFKFAEFEKKSGVHEELSLETTDERQIKVELRSNVYQVNNHNVIQYNIRDITKRKKLQEQLIQSQKMEVVGRLAAGITHDFNNLLTTIIGNAELVLMETGKDDPIYEMTDEIKKAGKSAAGLTRQLLAFSRKQILQLEVINLNEVVKEMEKMIRRIIGEDIELRATDLDTELGQVVADVGKMEQVIMNLCVNARDAMPKGGSLIIETTNVELDEKYINPYMATEPGPYVMLAVSDTGTGMTKEVQSSLFEPFFTTKEKGKGTGLGLSMVFGVVKQSKGNIWVYSEPGKGSTFKIYLPRCEATSSTLIKAGKGKELLHGSETVLVVEDDEMVRGGLAHLTGSGRNDSPGAE